MNPQQTTQFICVLLTLMITQQMFLICVLLLVLFDEQDIIHTPALLKNNRSRKRRRDSTEITIDQQFDFRSALLLSQSLQQLLSLQALMLSDLENGRMWWEKPKSIQHWNEVVLNTYTDSEFLQNFRMDRYVHVPFSATGLVICHF
jgi:hypothetical protein